MQRWHCCVAALALTCVLGQHRCCGLPRWWRLPHARPSGLHGYLSASLLHVPEHGIHACITLTAEHSINIKELRQPILNFPRGCVAHLNEDLVRLRRGMMCLPPPSCLLFSSFLLDEKLLPCICIAESAGLWPLQGCLPGSRVVPGGANSPSSLASLLTIHVPAHRQAWHVRTYLLGPTGCASKQTYHKRKECFSPSHCLAHWVHSRHL